MNVDVMTLETIMATLQAVTETIEKCQDVDVANVNDYLGELISLQPTQAEAQASAKYQLLKAKSLKMDLLAQKYKGEKLPPPSILKERISALVEVEEYVYEKAVRLSSGLSHAIEGVRSKLSYIKEEMRINQ